jgi:hypothetical protein
LFGGVTVEAFGLEFSFYVELVRLLDFTSFNNMRLGASLDEEVGAPFPHFKKNFMIDKEYIEGAICFGKNF